MVQSRGTFLQYLVFVALCLVFYGNTIPNGYAFDDSVVITENQFTQRGLAGIPEIFAHDTFRGSYENIPTVERYRPLSVATFAIENQLFGQNPHISHFINILLFGLTSLLLYRLFSKLFGNRDAAKGRLDLPFLATLLFIAHPVHTEIVANIKGRDEILALLGSLAATLLVLKYLDTRRARDLAWAALLFLLALFSKEDAIAFLAIVPLTIFFYKEEPANEYLRALWPLAAASVVFLTAMGLATRGTGPAPSEDILTEPFIYASFSQRYATVFCTFLRYLGLLVFPHPLTIDYYPYHIHLTNWKNPAVWVSILLYATATAYAFVKLKKRSIIAYGILFYLFTFFIVSNLPFSIGTFMSERFMFAPSVGFLLIVAWLLCSKVLARYKYFIVAPMLVACLVLTFERNRTWKDDFTLFTTDVQTSSDSIKGNLAAAVSYLEESHKTVDGELYWKYREEALKHSKKAVSLYQRYVDLRHVKAPSYDYAVMLVGDCHAANDDLAKALEAYARIIQSIPDQARLCETVEVTISKSKDIDFQLESYEKFAKLVPNNFVFNYRLGYLYGKEKNDLEKSIRYLEKAVEIQPTEPHALEALSHAYKLSKNYQKAAHYMEMAASEDPTDLSRLKRLLAIYELMGDDARQRSVRERIARLRGPGY